MKLASITQGFTMDELRFVLKCFVFAILFLVLTQIKTGDTTIEKQIESSLVNSKVSDFVNKVADGGVKLIKDGNHYANDYYQNWKNNDNTKPLKASEISVKATPKVKIVVLKDELEKREPNVEDDAELIEVE